jgi:hypothetical protein
MAVGILTGGEVPERLNGPVLKTGARKCRGFESHPLRHAMPIVAAMVVAACSFLPGKQYAFGFPPRDGVPELRGVLTDKTGTVTHVTTIEGMDPVPPIDRGMMMLGDAENSVIAYWIDGCEESVAVEVVDNGNNGSVDIDITLQPAAGPCDLVGVRRYLRIRFARPLDPMQTAVDFLP